MGVFGAFFACIGVVGFNGCCSGASSGDGGFTLACISGRRGVIGCIVAPWLCPMREKVLPARSQWLTIGVLWRAGRVYSRSSSRVILLGDLCRAAALVAGPSTGSVNPSMRSYTLWVAWWAARLGHHPSGQRAYEGAQATSCRPEVAAGCNVRWLGVARKRSGVMCGWLCSRVRTGAPRPNPGGALPQAIIRRSAVPPEWRT